MMSRSGAVPSSSFSVPPGDHTSEVPRKMPPAPGTAPGAMVPPELRYTVPSTRCPPSVPPEFTWMSPAPVAELPALFASSVPASITVPPE